MQKNKISIKDTDIAVIGMACRFPKSNTIEEYWDNLKNGVDCISTFSKEELKKEGISESLINHPDYVNRYGIIKNIDQFDASFFGFSPLEAKAMDPQHRLFLECCWEALEVAAYNPFDYKGLIGVFAGCGLNQYFIRNVFNNKAIVKKLGLHPLVILNSHDVLTSRVAYKLNLKGPAVTLQTTCSTSLVAVHHACQSLLNGESDITLAGGVSLSPTKEGYLYQERIVASPDGYCRTFDAKAAGTVGSSGVGIVVLKMAEDAIEDGDFIHAIIKGTAINNDGDNKVSFTAPSIEGQKKVILQALENAAVHPDEIGYIEAHGTATKLGDPIEVEALTQAMRTYTTARNFCAIGSVKTNMGHTDAAAGCAGLIKTILALQNKQIPPNLHYSKPNPHINFEQSPFFVNTKLTDWPQKEYTRKAGVNSFGIGGTNAHVIVEEAPEMNAIAEQKRWRLIILSAHDKKALDRSINRLKTHVKTNPHQKISDIAYTLQVGRKSFAVRFALLCQSSEELITVLSQQSHPFRIRHTLSFENAEGHSKKISNDINAWLEQHQQLLTTEKYEELVRLLVKQLQKWGMEIDFKDCPSTSSEAQFLYILSQLWLQKITINWKLINAGRSFRRVPLITYPFQRETFWVSPDNKADKNNSHLLEIKKDSEKEATEENKTNSLTIENTLTEIWKDHLEMKKINANDDFFGIGGNSLLAVALLEEVNKQLQCKLQVDSLIDYPTIGELAAHIAQGSHTKSLPFCLVPLQKGSIEKTPLFLIHPVGGTVYLYKDLAATLNRDQTVYGLQAQSLDGKTPHDKNIESMADRYVKIIQQIQPKGPYCLGGSSFGGIVAYQMAQQLLQLGEDIKNIFLIDTPGPGFFPKKIESEAELLDYFIDFHHEELPNEKSKNMSQEEKRNYLLKQIGVSPDSYMDQGNLFFKIFQENMNIMYNYQPKDFQGKAVAFAARSLLNKYFSKSLEQVWKPFVKGGLDSIQIPGNHITMNQMPNVKKTGRIIQAYLDEEALNF